MSERFVTYFWERRTFCGSIHSDSVYFDDLKDSPEAKNVIFPFLLSPENANMREIRDVAKIYFADYGHLRDIEGVLNNCIFSLYGFKASGEKVLITSAPLFMIPLSPIYSGVIYQVYSGVVNEQDPRYRIRYRNIQMSQIYDFFNIVLSFPEQIVLSYPVKMGICIEAISKATNEDIRLEDVPRACVAGSGSDTVLKP